MTDMPTPDDLPPCSICGSSTSPRARWLGHEGEAICRPFEGCATRERENEAVDRERKRIAQELRIWAACYEPGYGSDPVTFIAALADKLEGKYK